MKFGDGIITTALLIIIGILLFELIIFVHEFGHFICAKKSGIKVNEFALGMGPKIFSFQKGETTYSLRIFPIGGFCAMEGEDEENDNPRAFNNAKVWKRMIVIVAGAIMNIILGFVLMFVIVVQSDSYVSKTIESFPESSFSANCGLKAGDTFKKVNGYSIINSRDLSFAIATSPLSTVNGDSVNIYKQDCANSICKVYYELTEELKDNKEDKDKQKYLDSTLTKAVKMINEATSQKDAYEIYGKMVGELGVAAGKKNILIPDIEVKATRQRYRTDVEVIRDGETVVLKDVDFFTYKSDKGEVSVAIDFFLNPIEKNVFTVLSQTGEQTVSVVRMIWSSLVGMIQGKYGLNDISGPVGATSAISQIASEGLKESFGSAVNNIVFMMMVISVNLGIFNMLPFPALDGGRFVFLVIEAIRKKPVPRKYEAIVNGIGLALLLALMLLVTVKDVWQLFGG